MPDLRHMRWTALSSENAPESVTWLGIPLSTAAVPSGYRQSMRFGGEPRSAAPLRADLRTLERKLIRQWSCCRIADIYVTAGALFSGWLLLRGALRRWYALWSCGSRSRCVRNVICS